MWQIAVRYEDMGGDCVKVKFLGMYNAYVGSSATCGVCRAKARSTKSFQRTKQITFATGQTRTFLIHRVETVSEAEGEFLLGLTYKLQGEDVHMFQKVDD